MKLSFFVLLALVVSCATPPFKRNNVCSDASLSYLKDHKSSYVKNNDQRVQKKVSKIADEVKACYKAEIRRETYSKPSFNLCLVAGYDKGGKLEHFEFSSKQYRMSDSMKSCLGLIKSNRGLKGLKNISFIQPYRLKPKKSY